MTSSRSGIDSKERALPFELKVKKVVGVVQIHMIGYTDGMMKRLVVCVMQWSKVIARPA